MKKWVMGGVFFVIALGLVWLYNLAGLRQYIRAVAVMNKMPAEARQKVWEEFTGTDPRGAERGILAGSWLGRIWVWGSTGLESYKVDELSIYSFFDGCRDEVKARLNKGEKNVFQQEIYTSLDKWKERTSAGDYVTVYVAKAANGGTQDNLREIYGYNFWLFMNTGIDIECAK